MKKYRLIHLFAASALLASPIILHGQDEEPVADGESTSTEYDPVSAAVLYDPVDVPEQEGEEPEAIIVAEDPITAFSVGDLERMIHPPSRLKEYQEDLENPQSLFTPEEHVKIFGETPSFIYYPEGPDPMIIPWVRDRVIAEEMFADAMVAKNNQDWERALELLEVVREKYPNTAEGQQSPAEISQVRRAIENDKNPGSVPEVPEGPTEPKLALPQWIRQNTTAIVINDRPVTLVGNDFLRAGDSVPRYPMVKVKTITPSEVVYVYQNEEFKVEVSGQF